MKILVVTSIFPPDHGGPASYVPAICTALSDHHQVQVITLADDVNSSDYYPFSIVRIPRQMNRLLRTIKVISEIYRCAKFSDVVYLNGLVFEGVLAAKILSRKKVVIKVVGDLIWERARLARVTQCLVHEFHAEKLSLYWRFLRRLQCWYTQRADKVITPSEYLRKVVQSWGVERDKTTTIYNAVEIAEPSNLLESEFDFVTVCRLVPWKGVDVLIRLAAKNGWRLNIVGDGPDRAVLEALVRSLDARSLVVFSGHVPKERVSHELRRARVFVLNSSYEGLPHVVLEAKAAGVPVIATAVGGTPEAIRDGWDGALVDHDDIHSLEKTLMSLLSDHSLRTKYVDNSLARMVSEFSFDQMVRRTEELLRFSGGSTPLNILMISRDRGLLPDGGDISSDTLQRHIEYARLLEQRHPGSELRILVFSSKDQPERLVLDNVPLRIVGTRSRFKSLFIFDSVVKLKQLFLDGWRPTLVTTQTLWEDGLLGYLVASKTGAKFLPQVHLDIFSKEWETESRLNRLRRPLGRWISNKADGVRVVSAGIARTLEDLWHVSRKKIFVIPVSVDFTPMTAAGKSAKQALGLDEDTRVVLFVGRFYRPKNLDMWITVAAEVLKKQPKTRFVLAGDGPEFQRIREKVDSLGDIAKYFLFLGNVERDELPIVYAAANVLLLTSHYEGFGRVIVEARMAGVPVVSTDCIGPRDLIRSSHDGYLLPQGDVRGMTDAVITLLKDGQQAMILGAVGREETYARFDQSVLRNDLVTSWERVVAR